jgi:monothiol glutaredoxin
MALLDGYYSTVTVYKSLFKDTIKESQLIMDIVDTIKGQIADNPVLIYMKGSPDAPQCGFSAQATQILMACGERFAYIDILANPDIRATLPSVSDWPTFPQLFVGGELVGGCDIIAEMHQSGELQPMIKAVAVSED